MKDARRYRLAAEITIASVAEKVEMWLSAAPFRLADNTPVTPAGGKRRARERVALNPPATVPIG